MQARMKKPERSSCSSEGRVMPCRKSTNIFKAEAAQMQKNELLSEAAVCLFS